MTDRVLDRSGFESAWEIAGEIPGWLTREQASDLWHAARQLPPGATIVEIGSHQGRSTVVLAHAAARVGGRVMAIDAFCEGPMLGGAATKGKFEANVARAGLAGSVELLVNYSTKLRPQWNGPVDLLYVDGKHDYWTFGDDLRWSDWLPANGPIFVHDCFSSIGVTSGVLVKVLPSRRYAFSGRTGSLARFERRPPTGADRWRLIQQLPWFARNVIIKVLLRLRLRPVAATLGHAGPYDPY
ncbi:MAG TPA: class I SAM-dependent methyltransferase [Rugosimonospora sp.]|nr:class I SAM-dependent methyltransferase [Rugosimonospora sp.]